jgi:hypothetical protein
MAQQQFPKRYSTVLQRLMRDGVCPSYEEWDAEDRHYCMLFERAWDYPILEAEIIAVTAAYWAWKKAVRAHQPEAELQDQFDRRYNAFYQAAVDALRDQNPIRRTKVDESKRERLERPKASSAVPRRKPGARACGQTSLGPGLSQLELNLEPATAGRQPPGRGLGALGFEVASGEGDPDPAPDESED